MQYQETLLEQGDACVAPTGMKIRNHPLTSPNFC